MTSIDLAHKHAPRLARCLCLAAAPCFGGMALLSAIDAGSSAAMICSASGGSGFALHGMTAMYALMAVFHLPPWLRLSTVMAG